LLGNTNKIIGTTRKNVVEELRSNSIQRKHVFDKRIKSNFNVTTAS